MSSPSFIDSPFTTKVEFEAFLALPPAERADAWAQAAAGNNTSRATTSIASVADFAAAHPDELWIFVYGSLMWAVPEGVDVVCSERATLHGFSRSFCLYSRNYRGTAELPGLCLGLQRKANGTCEGVALKVRNLNSLELIDAQEMVLRNNPLPIYVRQSTDVRLHDAARSRRRALTFVANPDDCVPPEVSDEERASMIASRRGLRGANRDYLFNTASQLEGTNQRSETQDHTSPVADLFANSAPRICSTC